VALAKKKKERKKNKCIGDNSHDTKAAARQSLKP